MQCARQTELTIAYQLSSFNTIFSFSHRHADDGSTLSLLRSIWIFCYTFRVIPCLSCETWSAGCVSVFGVLRNRLVFHNSFQICSTIICYEFVVSTATNGIHVGSQGNSLQFESMYDSFVQWSRHVAVPRTQFNRKKYPFRAPLTFHFQVQNEACLINSCHISVNRRFIVTPTWNRSANCCFWTFWFSSPTHSVGVSAK